MNRRRLLEVAGTALFSGCVTGTDRGSGNTPTPAKNQTPTATPTPTPEPTPTETPLPLDPIAKLANPVYRWTGFGDAIRNNISGVGQGAKLPVAGRFKIWIHDGTLNYNVQARVSDSSGTQIGLESYSNRQITDITGHANWETFLSFDTTTWDRGTYQGEYIVRDNILDESSLDGSADSIKWTVDIVDPLRDGEAAMADQTIPGSVRAGETFDYSLTFENKTDRDSSIVSSISTRVDGEEWKDSHELKTYNLPAGESVEYSFRGASLSEPGRYEFRLDTVGITWSINVSDSS